MTDITQLKYIKDAAEVRLREATANLHNAVQLHDKLNELRGLADSEGNIPGYWTGSFYSDINKDPISEFIACNLHFEEPNLLKGSFLDYTDDEATFYKRKKVRIIKNSISRITKDRYNAILKAVCNKLQSTD